MKTLLTALAAAAPIAAAVALATPAPAAPAPGAKCAVATRTILADIVPPRHTARDAAASHPGGEIGVGRPVATHTSVTTAIDAATPSDATARQPQQNLHPRSQTVARSCI
ncbi:hypothetical protein ACQPZJ_44535 [Actinoplanes sp. CA-054009]